MKMKKIFATILVFALVLCSTSHYGTMKSVQAASAEDGSVEEYHELGEAIHFDGEERLYKENSEAARLDETGTEIESKLGKIRSASNDDPNGAYYLPFNSPQSDNIDTEGENRWWGVISEETARISTMMVAGDDTVDFDLYIYRLNEETSTLELVGYSIEDAGAYEIVDMVVDAGTYYIQIASHSGTGTFALVSYLSTQYIANEINDTIEYATDLPEQGTITDAIDSPIDLDVYGFALADAAKKSFALTCPSGCNYKMYIYEKSTGDSHDVISGEIYSLEAGTYYLVVAPADGTYSSSLPYTLTVTHENFVAAPENLLEYNGYVLQRGGASGLDYYINGKKIDFSYEYKYNVSVGDSYLNATMKMTTRSTSTVCETAEDNHEGIMFIKYKSSFNSSSRNLALYIPINDVNYSYHRSASDSMAPTSVHISKRVFAYVIVDVDTGKVIDLFSPNWYYDSGDSNHSHSIANVYAIYEDFD